MNYQETLQYLYACAPLFQHVGGAAYKEGLYNTHTLDAHFGHPHRSFRTVHVAGTNGKGSCAHTLAALCQLCGLRTGLYTSPHLLDFRERVRVDGKMMSEQYVVDFVAREKAFFEPLHPSFFEVATAMAFRYFADEHVDVAIIEVGMGGRLDCTNIITPELSVITNISLDHTQFLGGTLAEIAREKAGIIKPAVPVVVGETLPETRPVFQRRADDVGAPVIFAEDTPDFTDSWLDEAGLRHYRTTHWGELVGELAGDCQVKNANTILHAVDVLQERGFFPANGQLGKCLSEAFRHVCSLTGLMGRWQMVAHRPDVDCDTGHYVGVWQYLAPRLKAGGYARAHIVFGMMADKDVDAVLSLLPLHADYYFTQASVSRSLSAADMQERARRHGLSGNAYDNVGLAYEAAKRSASPDDLIYIGGSGFVVADFLALSPIGL